MGTVRQTPNVAPRFRLGHARNSAAVYHIHIRGGAVSDNLKTALPKVSNHPIGIVLIDLTAKRFEADRRHVVPL